MVDTTAMQYMTGMKTHILVYLIRQYETMGGEKRDMKLACLFFPNNYPNKISFFQRGCSNTHIPGCWV